MVNGLQLRLYSIKMTAKNNIIYIIFILPSGNYQHSRYNEITILGIYLYYLVGIINIVFLVIWDFSYMKILIVKLGTLLLNAFF